MVFAKVRHKNVFKILKQGKFEFQLQYLVTRGKGGYEVMSPNDTFGEKDQPKMCRIVFEWPLMNNSEA